MGALPLTWLEEPGADDFWRAYDRFIGTMGDAAQLGTVREAFREGWLAGRQFERSVAVATAGAPPKEATE